MPTRRVTTPPTAAPATAPAAPPRQRRQRVQAAETGLAVLKGLGELGGRASLTALAAQVGESPAKVHRYLVSLLQAGFALQDAGSGHYQLGPEAIQLGLYKFPLESLRFIERIFPAVVHVDTFVNRPKKDNEENGNQVGG